MGMIPGIGLIGRVSKPNDDGKYQAAVMYNHYIYVSSDYGASFQTRGSANTWTAVTMSSTGQYMYACTSSGYIFKSSDYGQSWTQCAYYSTRYFVSIKTDSTGSYIHAVQSGTNYLYKSNNYGSSWTTGNLSSAYSGVSCGGSLITIASGTAYIQKSTDYGSFSNITAAGSG